MMLLPTTAALLSWMWQSTLCLGVCWLLYQFLRQEPYFHYNRRYLLLTPWLALLLPLLLTAATPWLRDWLPSKSAPVVLAVPAIAVVPAIVVSGPVTEVASAPFSWWTWLPLLYAAGVLAWLMQLGWQLLALWRQVRQLPREKHEDFTLVLTSGQLPISSFGRLIFWDEAAEITPTEANQILAHELIHVQQGHTQERLLLELARAVLWFNPFVHCYSRSLDLTHEYIADAAVLETLPAPAAPTKYAALLARLALQRLRFQLPPMHSFSQSQLLARIAMLHTPRYARRWKQWLLLPVSFGLLVTVACEKRTELAPPITTVDSTYTRAEQIPVYQGGMSRLVKDISFNMHYEYPAIAKMAIQEKVEGQVFVKFTVATDGTVQAVQVQKGIPTNSLQQQAAARGLEQLAVKVVQDLPGRWTPGTQDGTPVAVSYTVPIAFYLAKGTVAAPGYNIMAPDSTAAGGARYAFNDKDVFRNPPRPAPDSHNVYAQVEEMPEYPGGQGQLLAELLRRLRYPAAAKAAKLDGVAFVKFVVAADGSMQNIGLQKGVLAPKGLEAVAKEMDQAAVATLYNLPRSWKPGMQRGKEVAVSYTVPITFQL
ncbi:TonB family protein [Hymenobacter sp. BT186]|uniref:TonB family protein n=1 Tax=Hymenobacter telluris TaxID=2816474 RepID=A0A939EVL1_9BACT|nr:M56 family metallopeptidase [Hymenobacter telluris]MBO0358320.1 TonB family protein [Hymenobacter telluris]MBW3374346.1 TonB family protein [Hymenobacter norwichensis]